MVTGHEADTKEAQPAQAGTVEITADGDLRISAAMAARYFPSDSLVAMAGTRRLWLLPLTGPEGGGLLLKQRNAAGDRSTLIREALPTTTAAGRYSAAWDDERGALGVTIE